MSERRWYFIDRSDLLTGEEYPSFDHDRNADRELASALWPRRKSLIWVARKQPSAFAPALFQFAKKHRRESRKHPETLPEEGWSLLTMIPIVDQLREALAADWEPLAPISSWSRALFGGVDEVVNVMWLLRVGWTVPAALAARALLERWTYNLASYHELEQLAGEPDPAFISRVWQSYEHLGVSPHVGAWWGTLSEIVHARQTAGRLGGGIVGSVSVDPLRNVDIHRGICLVVELCLRQIRGGLTVMVAEAGQSQYIPILQASTPTFRVPREPLDLTAAYEDLDYYEAHRVLGERWTQLAAIYRELVKDPARELTAKFDPVLTIESLLERRGRAIEGARAAFASEKIRLGEEFDPGFLAARLFRYACFSELACLMREDGSRVEDDALLAASQCLEAAVHAWLEDSDHSMGYVRVVLEQTARLRCHRLKPARALRMEERGDASASRWLEEAGWRRLSLLMRAVNEFAHLGLRSRRSGARAALLQIQLSDPSEETSRGKALDSVAHLLAFELLDRLRSESEDAAQCFIETVTLVDEPSHLRTLERYLNNAQSLRDFSFGAPDFG